MSTMLFLTIRVLHILLAAVWLGAAFFLTVFLEPTVRALGPTGGQVMVGLTQRKFLVFIAIVAGTTVLTGIWLYWRFTGGFDPAVSGSISGMVFGAGGLLGIVAAVVGGSVVGRSSKQIALLAQQVAALPDGSEKASRLQTMAALRQRLAVGSQIVIVLLIVTFVLMALGHYV
jgi:uncharacterized membrane protein